MGVALTGLAGSIAVYVIGLASWARLAKRSWSEQPAQLPEELELARGQADSWRLRDHLLRPPGRASVVWIIVGAATFAVLWAAEFGIVFTITFVALLSAWLTYGVLRHARSGSERRPVPGPRRLAFVGSAYLLTVGSIAATCFLGISIAFALGAT